MAADLIWLVSLQGVNTAVASVNPVRLMAFDRAGNILARIRLNSIRDHDYSGLSGSDAIQSFLHDPAHGFVTQGFTEYGTAITAVGEKGNDAQIRDFVATADGTLYCAMGSSASNPANVRQPKSGISVAQITAELGPSSLLTGTAWSDRFLALTDPIPTGWTAAFIPDRFFAVYRRNGDRVDFPDLHGAPILSVQRDSSGNLFVGGMASGAEKNYLRKYDNAGTLIWSAGTTATISPYWWTAVQQIALDSAGNVYAVGYEGEGAANAVGGSFLKKYNSSGALKWTRRFFYIVNYVPAYAVAVDDEDNVYCGSGRCKGYFTSLAPSYYDLVPWAGNTGYGYSDPTDEFYHSLSKWDSGGNLLAAVTVPITLHGSNPSGNGNVYTVVFANSKIYANGALYNKSLVAQTWTWVAGYNTPGDSGYPAPTVFEVDTDGSVFFNRLVASPYRLAAFDSAFTPLFSTQDLAADVAQISLDSANWNTQGAVKGGRKLALVTDSALPAISLGMGLGVPSWIGDLYTALPGLPLRIAMGLIETIRDYVGPIRPVVYRLYLTGSPDIELLLKSIQIRRTIYSKTLSVVVPVVSSAQVAQIQDRAAGDLILHRGVRLSSGAEQLDELIRLPLTTVRYDGGAGRASITLSGADSDAISHKTRTLYGANYQAIQGGRRRVRCAVDTYLRPGDTIAVLGDSWVVDEIVCTIDATTAVMECAEFTP